MKTRKSLAAILSAALCLNVASAEVKPANNEFTQEKRANKTQLTRRTSESGKPPRPPKKLFKLVKFPSSVGKLNAYVTPNPSDGKKHPAIIWLIGGMSNGLGATPWNDDEPQSASPYRKAGMIMMFPSRRGGNDNPGVVEGFYGEVDDVIAAAQYLQTLPYVDPNRIYLGGHSTGGTLALLVAASSTGFKGVLSLGPAMDPTLYGNPPYNPENMIERILRAPIVANQFITSPTIVIEGEDGNATSVREMDNNSKNQNITFKIIPGDHFNIIESTNRKYAKLWSR